MVLNVYLVSVALGPSHPDLRGDPKTRLTRSTWQPGCPSVAIFALTSPAPAYKTIPYASLQLIDTMATARSFSLSLATSESSESPFARKRQFLRLAHFRFNFVKN